MRDDDGNLSLLVEAIARYQIQELTYRKSNEPRNSQTNRHESIVNGKGVERPILGVEGKGSSFPSNLLGSVLFLDGGWRISRIVSIGCRNGKGL